MPHESAATWAEAGRVVARAALEAQCQDQFELAAALRSLAVAAYLNSDSIEEHETPKA